MHPPVYDDVVENIAEQRRGGEDFGIVGTEFHIFKGNYLQWAGPELRLKSIFEALA